MNNLLDEKHTHCLRTHRRFRGAMGKALTLAESDAGQGNLSLTQFRAGSSAAVVLKLPVLGSYSAKAPQGNAIVSSPRTPLA